MWLLDNLLGLCDPRDASYSDGIRAPAPPVAGKVRSESIHTLLVPEDRTNPGTVPISCFSPFLSHILPPFFFFPKSISWIANRWTDCQHIIRWHLWETRFPQVVGHWKALTRTTFLLGYSKEIVMPSRTHTAFLDNVGISRCGIHDSTYPERVLFFLVEDSFAVATVSHLCCLVLIPSGGNGKSL